MTRLFELTRLIDRTYVTTEFREGRTISDANAEREVLTKRLEILTKVAEAASTRQLRYSKSEVRSVATVSVGELQRRIDRLAREYRELDNALQELSWKTELVRDQPGQ